MQSDVIFAVLIPVFNRPSFALRAIKSVLSQDYESFHIICVDDGSQNYTRCLLDRIATENCRVHVVHQENQGVASARNRAVRYLVSLQLNVDWVIWLDSDDCLEQGIFERINRIANRIDADCLWLSTLPLDTEGWPESLVVKNNADPVKVDSEEILKDMYFHGADFPLWGKAFRLSAFDALCFDERLQIGEDLDFVIRYLSEDPKIYKIDCVGYRNQTGDLHPHLMADWRNMGSLLSLCETDLNIYFLYKKRLSAESRVFLRRVCGHLLSLYGLFQKKHASDSFLARFQFIKTAESKAKIIFRARPTRYQEKIKRLLYLYCRPAFCLAYLFRRLRKPA